jgi:hypothetical protein
LEAAEPAHLFLRAAFSIFFASASNVARLAVLGTASQAGSVRKHWQPKAPVKISTGSRLQYTRDIRPEDDRVDTGPNAKLAADKAVFYSGTGGSA